MNSFSPSHGLEAQWEEAHERLEFYLRALRIVGGEHQLIVHQQILRSATSRHAVQSAAEPTALTIEEAHAAMDEWFHKIVSEEHHFENGQVSLLVANAVEKWPSAFLAEELPPEFARAMQECKVQAGPDLQITSMVPRPLDDDPAGETRTPPAELGAAWITPLVVFCSLLSAIVIFLSR